jgi:hypothetical protein
LPRYAPLTVVVVVVLNLAACGSEVGGDGRLQDFVDAGLIGQSLADELSAPQRAILADGEVIFAEYQRAILAFIGCMEDEGLLIDGFGLGADQTYHYGYGVPHGSPMSRVEIDAIHWRCGAEHGLTVESLWQTSFRPSAEAPR